MRNLLWARRAAHAGRSGDGANVFGGMRPPRLIGCAQICGPRLRGERENAVGGADIDLVGEQRAPSVRCAERGETRIIGKARPGAAGRERGCSWPISRVRIVRDLDRDIDQLDQRRRADGCGFARFDFEYLPASRQCRRDAGRRERRWPDRVRRNAPVRRMASRCRARRRSAGAGRRARPSRLPA